MSMRLVALAVAIVAALALVPRRGAGDAAEAGHDHDHGQEGPARRRRRPSRRCKKGTDGPDRRPTDAGREVHLHGYDIEKKVVRRQARRVAFRAKIPGRFELELHHPDVLLAELTVK